MAACRVAQHGQRLVQPPLANIAADAQAFALEVLAQLALRNRDMLGDMRVVEGGIVEMLVNITVRRRQPLTAQSPFENGHGWTIRRSMRLPSATWIMASETSRRCS